MKKLKHKGNAAIILCLSMTTILAFTAYVIDIGMIYIERVRLSNALDSAVLAAALELPKDRGKAMEIALEYLEKNEVDPKDTIINISEDNKSIQIEGKRQVQHLFAPVLGINESGIDAVTKAIVGPVKSVKGGIRPFAIEDYDYPYGELVSLKEGAGDGSQGNYGAVALGGQGSSDFLARALYGYNGTISVGDYIDTETGNMSGATNDIKNHINSEYSSFDNFERSSIRLWTIPIVDSLDINGRSAVQIVGFAEFYVEDVQGQSGKIEIKGRFIRHVVKGEIDMNLEDRGVYGVKLVK